MSPALVALMKAVAYTVLVLLASPLLEGLMRKLKAFIHSRKGPPVTQPYLDLAKLLIKEDLVSEPGVIARFAAPGAFACVLCAAFFVPFGVTGPAQAAGDIFPFIYLMTLSSACVMAGGLAHASPFSHLGSSREMMMVLTVEAALIISLLIVALGAHSALPSDMAHSPFRLSGLLGVFVYFFGMQAMMGKLPFDIPEADQEIMEGPFIEYSGPSLALFKWSFCMKALVLGSLLFNTFIAWPRVEGLGWLGSLLNFGINFVAVMLIGVLAALVDATNPRLKIAQSMRFFAGLIAVGLIGVGLAAYGL